MRACGEASPWQHVRAPTWETAHLRRSKTLLWRVWRAICFCFFVCVCVATLRVSIESVRCPPRAAGSAESKTMVFSRWICTAQRQGTSIDRLVGAKPDKRDRPHSGKESTQHRMEGGGIHATCATKKRPTTRNRKLKKEKKKEKEHHVERGEKYTLVAYVNTPAPGPESPNHAARISRTTLRLCECGRAHRAVDVVHLGRAAASRLDLDRGEVGALGAARDRRGRIRGRGGGGHLGTRRLQRRRVKVHRVQEVPVRGGPDRQCAGRE